MVGDVPTDDPPTPEGMTDADASYDLDDAYAVETPADNVELYRKWAASYEDDFMAGHGYVYHTRVAELFAQVADESDGPVLDVGCGTGVVGQEIARLGRWAIDGLDISTSMLAKAAEKLNRAGAEVYGALIEADLTGPLDIASDTYGSVVSAGTFTTGHVGPEAIGELARIVRPGGLLVLGVNSRYWAAADFESHLRGFVERGVLAEPTLEQIPIYDRHDHEHGTDTAQVIVVRTPGS